MPGSLTFTLAQINPIVGDIKGNAAKILEIWSGAKSDLVILPELALSGYPPEDLVLKPAFMDDIEHAVSEIQQAGKDLSPGLILPCPWRIEGRLYNAFHLIEHGEIIATQAKYILPNEGVFDEKRTFKAGKLPEPTAFRKTKLGILICEDMWRAEPAAHLKENGAEVLITLNASPYTVEKQARRLEHARKRVSETALPLIYINQVGGQDELVFDGRSFALDREGNTTHYLKNFKEDIKTISLSDPKIELVDPTPLQNIYKALCLGLHDYTTKNSFPGVMLGLSGGIDSALAAVLAVDALGADKVHCVMMPSRYTSQDSLDDAAELAKNLGCAYDIIPIEPYIKSFEETLPHVQEGTIAHENIQSRTRALILMSLSNANGKMLLSTGNKSELAVGYATLYGDMCGGFNPLKDLYKTKLYELCHWRNEQNTTIPARILTKAPTAELKDNQSDQDSLPPYGVLDDILECLIEHEMNLAQITKKGHDPKVIRRIWNMLDRAEYKRRQAPPGTVITSKAFGRDRRYSMTNYFSKSLEKEE